MVKATDVLEAYYSMTQAEEELNKPIFTVDPRYDHLVKAHVDKLTAQLETTRNNFNVVVATFMRQYMK